MITITKSTVPYLNKPSDLTEPQLLESTNAHIADVKKGMDFFAKMMREAGGHHDYTKVEFISDFFKQVKEAQKTGKWPEGSEWWYEKYHLTERHHLKNRCPEDVNLVDVFEMLVDCVMAGLARKGEYQDEEPDANLLVKAYKNTVKLLLSNTEVKEPSKPTLSQEDFHFTWGKKEG